MKSKFVILLTVLLFTTTIFSQQKSPSKVVEEFLAFSTEEKTVNALELLTKEEFNGMPVEMLKFNDLNRIKAIRKFATDKFKFGKAFDEEIYNNKAFVKIVGKSEAEEIEFTFILIPEGSNKDWKISFWAELDLKDKWKKMVPKGVPQQNNCPKCS